MHVHILNKVCDQKWTDWNIHIVTHGNPYFICKGDGEEFGTHVDISTCTDACTHSIQGVRTKLGDWDTYTVSYRVTHVSMYLCKGSGAHFWSQVDMHTCNDAYTYSKQGVGPEVWDWGPYTDPQRGTHDSM